MQPPDSERRYSVLNARGSVPTARERVLEAAYELFSRSGTRAVGVDAITTEAGVSKMSLYRNFSSKEDLALAYLELREERWTRGWLKAEVRSRATDPAQRLLAIFDVFGEWFARSDYEGCAFVSVLLELDEKTDRVRQASVCHLAYIREFLAELALECGIRDPEGFARQWDILMKGAIVAAAAGDLDAARRAQELGQLLLARHGVACRV